MRVSVGLVCALVVSMVSVVRAEPLNPKRVAADAKWVAHLDVDAMRGSVVVDKAYQQCEEKVKQFAGQIPELVLIAKAVNPNKDWKGVTAYGADLKKSEGVVILQANFTDDALTALNEAGQQLPNAAVKTHGAYEVSTWTHKCPKGEHTVAGAYVQPDLLVLGSSPEAVFNALDVLDGSKPALDSKSPLATEAPAGSLLLVRVAGLADMPVPVESPIVKKPVAVGLAVGENNNEAYLTIELFTKDTKGAEDVQTEVENALTSALLAIDDADLADLINAVQVSANEKVVIVDVRGPADVGWNYLEKLIAKLAEAGQKLKAGEKK